MNVKGIGQVMEQGDSITIVHPPKEKKQEKYNFIREWWFVISILSFSLIFNVFFKVAIVNGVSMEPTYHDGNYLLLSRGAALERGMVVVIKSGTYLDEEGKKQRHNSLVKRIIGLPGETLEITSEGRIFINGKLLEDDFEPMKDSTMKITIPEGYYFVLGDNRNNSADSRYFGCFSKHEIMGSVISFE